MENILNNFRLLKEKEDVRTVTENIEQSVVFKGTNLWILIFAIFIASLGLNVNSTAVIIGAMLISPLMGPIIGVGFSLAVEDLKLFQLAGKNFLFAVAVSLITSTVYFFLSPIHDAHSEILARTTPNIYDVLIAFFGGLAGVLAQSSKLKGNVIIGVAIATALMPPLCTAGYGIATWQWKFFFGAIYLFTINCVFIAVAAFLIVRVLRFPVKEVLDQRVKKRVHGTIIFITLLTLIPSIYFGYKLIDEDRFVKRVNQFIDVAGRFENNYLLKRDIRPAEKKIILTYGGRGIDDSTLIATKAKLQFFGLGNAQLEIQHGFAFLQEQLSQLREDEAKAFVDQKQFNMLLMKMDSIQTKANINDLNTEAKVLFPSVEQVLVGPKKFDSTSQRNIQTILLVQNEAVLQGNQLRNWLQLRFPGDSISLFVKKEL